MMKRILTICYALLTATPDLTLIMDSEVSIAALGSIAWITRKVVQRNIGPLNELMEATNKISEGNYDTIIASTNHNDAVGKLQNAFRKMQISIMSHQNEIKLADAEIEKESAELEQVIPLAQEVSKRRQIFIQNISHQFTTPINIIEGLTHVLLNNIANRLNGKTALSQQSEEISQINTTLKHNATLIQRNTYMLYDSSDMGHADTSRYKREDVVPCNELALECIDYTMKQFYIEPIQFYTELPESVTVKTNRLYLMRTIREILHNAAKFSDGQHITLRVMQAKTAIRFVIEDVGPGLTNDLKELLFVPFTKVDDLSEGLGLGLPLCMVHAKAIGGELIYDKSYQQGCRIILEVPSTTVASSSAGSKEIGMPQ